MKTLTFQTKYYSVSARIQQVAYANLPSFGS